MDRRSAFAASVGVFLPAFLAVILHVQTAKAFSPLVGLLFQEVNEVQLSKQGDQSVVAVKGKAWMWNHNITFHITDSSGRQCLNNFLEILNAGHGRQLQFSGYYSGQQTIDQASRTTTTDFTVITECYFR